MNNWNYKKFILDDSGQTTTEYILILAVVVTMIMNFKTQFKSIIEKLFGKVNEQIDEDIFE
jgi:Flp pilus assembly pilin Flp